MKHWSGSIKTQLGYAALPLLFAMRRSKVFGQRKKTGLFAVQVKPHGSGPVGSGQLTRPDSLKR